MVEGMDLNLHFGREILPFWRFLVQEADPGLTLRTAHGCRCLWPAQRSHCRLGAVVGIVSRPGSH